MNEKIIRHFDEARQSTLEALQALRQEGQIQRAVLMPDIFARIRVVGWLPADAAVQQQSVEQRLQESAGPFWGGFWAAPGQTPTDAEMLESVWEESEPLEEAIRLNERYRSMGVWLRLPMEPPWQTDDTAKDYGAPIVTFYSFRGGVGRTTALAAFALQRANKGELVMVVDLDMEAPGISALLSAEVDTVHWGVVDYLLEQPLLKNVELRDYSYLASPQLTGTGKVFLVPAGRFDEDYLTKLARVDFNPPPSGSDEPHPLQSLLLQIRDEFQPHWILLDSRTGLSEVAGFALGGFAHLNVVFGTTSEQSWQGLRYAIRRLGADRIQRGLAQAECLLVQGMVSDNPEVSEPSESTFNLRAEDEFRNFYYAEDPEDPDEDRLWYIRDMESRDAPHVPAPLYYTQRLAFFTTLEKVKETLLTSRDYVNLCERIASRFTGGAR